MRIAVLIVGLLLGLLMFIQSVLVAGFASDENISNGGAVGILAALMWLLACALVLPFPGYHG